jgi:uncharacterized repeat protein (TIGR03847 family)
MSRFEIDIDPVVNITADAIGQPGERVFYMQATGADRTITLLVEKIQLQTLAIGLEQFLAEVYNRQEGLPEASAAYDEDTMHINPPVDPMFRVGELGLAYDSARDCVILVAREIVTGGDDPEEGGVVRFWCSRSQMRAMCAWALVVGSRGRPICPTCGEPMEAEGHLCPKKNGHKH